MTPDTGNYAVQWVKSGESFASYQMIRATSRDIALSVDYFRCDGTYSFRVFVMQVNWTISDGHSNQNVTPHSSIMDVSMVHPCDGSVASSTTSSTTTTVPPGASGGLISIGGTGSDLVQDSVVDGSGNLYMTGSFQSTVDFDPGAGAYPLTSAGGNDVFIAKLNASGSFVWAVRVGGSTGEIAYGIAVDASGNVHVTGYFTGTVDFDPGGGTSDLTSAGSNEVFVVKLDSSGTFVWAKRFGGSASDFGLGVSLDSSGNVYTTGYFNGTVDFGPTGDVRYRLTSVASNDVFVVKLDSSGSSVWAKSFGGNGTDSVYEIVVDGSGNVYTTGFFFGTVDFDPGAGTSNLTATGTDDVFVSKLDSSGSLVWAKSFGGTSTDYGRAIAVDSSGNVYTTGNFRGTVDFDPGAGTSNLTSAGNDDVFVSKLDSSGTFVWAKSFGGIDFDYGRAIAVDASGIVYVTGDFNGTVDFDPGAGTSNLTSAGDNDVFVSKLDSSGSLVWAKSFGGSSAEFGQSIEVDGSGNVTALGTFQLVVDFDPGAGTRNLSSLGSNDVFVSKLDSAGALRS